MQMWETIFVLVLYYLFLSAAIPTKENQYPTQKMP